MPFPIALIALHAAAQAPSPVPQSGGMVSNSAPPPVVRTYAPPPTIVYVAPPAPPLPGERDLPPSPPVLLDIQVSGEAGAIWEGSLRVGPSADYSESRSESRVTHCPAYPRHEQALHSSLSLRLLYFPTIEKPNQFTVMVDWRRPANPKGCGGPGERSVRLYQMIDLAPGARGVLRGDGGLTVRLRRR